MAKQIKQFRYYGENNVNNYPRAGSAIISKNTLSNNGTLFQNYTPIVKLGIQSLPGTIFYINDPYCANPIVIGYTGLYELDLDGVAEINSLIINGTSIDRINKIPAAQLIIDIVYDKED